MQKTFYLVTTLIEMSECVSDSHTLCSTIEKAEEAFKEEIQTSRENFFGRRGEFLIDIWGGVRNGEPRTVTAIPSLLKKLSQNEEACI